MGFFANTADAKTKLVTVQIPKGDKKRIYLIDVKARKSAEISLKSGNEIQASLKAAPFDGPKGIWVVEMTGTNIGQTTLEATFNKSLVASVTIEVFNKVLVALPQQATVEGALARLFLAESINPSDKSYSAEESKKSMIWMRKVIENRLASKKPSIFGINATQGKAPTIFDVIRARNQFHGFEAYPDINERIKVNLNNFIAIANEYNHPHREKYSAFIQNAIDAASQDALKGFLDPSPKGLYGWRTKDSSPPGGDFKAYANLAGQTFYTLK